jgi:hypothetical protein
MDRRRRPLRGRAARYLKRKATVDLLDLDAMAVALLIWLKRTFSDSEVAG